MITYPIHERFTAFQGEGVHLGRKAFFIRTFGCPVRCPWCDSAGTWHKGWIPKDVERVGVEGLVAGASEANPDFVVITGGEPTVHDLGPLCFGLGLAGHRVHLETCGAFKIDLPGVDWVTISPKWDKLPTKENILGAQEFKLIVEEGTSILSWVEKLSEIIGGDFIDHCRKGKVPVWLHPEWSRRSDADVLGSISKRVVGEGSPFRAGWQVHKLYKVDALDPRARPPAPLGGNEELYGY
jgi:7-carboxy-7-deazaguanine synthase